MFTNKSVIFKVFTNLQRRAANSKISGEDENKLSPWIEEIELYPSLFFNLSEMRRPWSHLSSSDDTEDLCLQWAAANLSS